tara:strand:- start:902 stop:1483 length:582 start_codon:yes stop_codon:yes gene_type:complete
MEINENLHNYIVTFDNVMPDKILKNFKRICKESEKFEAATIIGNETSSIDEEIRKTSTWSLSNINTVSLTEVHWVNFLMNTFNILIRDYQTVIKSNEQFEINNIQILKYNTGGHYKFHTDYHRTIPRVFSCIFLVNDDYEGGELIFKYPNSDKTTKIDRRENRMIIWPSTFLYPHSVMPVISGERYSVVAWAV